MDGTWKLTWDAEKKRKFYLVKTYNNGREKRILVEDTRDICKISHEQDIIDRFIEKTWYFKLCQILDIFREKFLSWYIIKK
jgi:hypothetical protein